MLNSVVENFGQNHLHVFQRLTLNPSGGKACVEVANGPPHIFRGWGDPLIVKGLHSAAALAPRKAAIRGHSQWQPLLWQGPGE